MLNAKCQMPQRQGSPRTLDFGLWRDTSNALPRQLAFCISHFASVREARQPSRPIDRDYGSISSSQHAVATGSRVGIAEVRFSGHTVPAMEIGVEQGIVVAKLHVTGHTHQDERG